MKEFLNVLAYMRMQLTAWIVSDVGPEVNSKDANCN